MPYKSREEEGQKVVLAGDRRMHHEGNREGKYGLDFVEIDKAIKISYTNKFKTYSRDNEQSSFNFIIFLKYLWRRCRSVCRKE